MKLTSFLLPFQRRTYESRSYDRLFQPLPSNKSSVNLDPCCVFTLKSLLDSRRPLRRTNSSRPLPTVPTLVYSSFDFHGTWSGGQSSLGMDFRDWLTVVMASFWFPWYGKLTRSLNPQDYSLGRAAPGQLPWKNWVTGEEPVTLLVRAEATRTYTGKELDVKRIRFVISCGYYC